MWVYQCDVVSVRTRNPALRWCGNPDTWLHETYNWLWYSLQLLPGRQHCLRQCWSQYRSPGELVCAGCSIAQHTLCARPVCLPPLHCVDTLARRHRSGLEVCREWAVQRASMQVIHHLCVKVCCDTEVKLKRACLCQEWCLSMRLQSASSWTSLWPQSCHCLAGMLGMMGRPNGTLWCSSAPTYLCHVANFLAQVACEVERWAVLVAPWVEAGATSWTCFTKMGWCENGLLTDGLDVHTTIFVISTLSLVIGILL